MDNLYKRGQIVYADFGNTEGSRQSGKRPCLIVQNDIGNKKSPTLIVAPLTSKWKKTYPFHVFVSCNKYNISRNSVVLCEQLITIDKIFAKNVIDKLDEGDMMYVDRALKISMGL